jgi:hypothetical protein
MGSPLAFLDCFSCLFFFFVLSHSCSIVVDPFTILLLFSIAILLVKLAVRVQVEPKLGSLSPIQKEAPHPASVTKKKVSN